MERVAHASHIGTPVEIDICAPCHVIWFDHLESTSLSPGSVIELFKSIHAARNEARNTVKMVIACPLCTNTLKNTSDIAKGGRFSYSRCANGHGRLISFTQFLREKNFIRSLQPYEISALAVKVKQIRCSSCGGPINLETDNACRHCGAAISVLDEAAVEKALFALQDKEVQRSTLDPARINDVLLASDANARRARYQRDLQHHALGPLDWLSNAPASGGLADLVELGIGAALANWLDD